MGWPVEPWEGVLDPWEGGKVAWEGVRIAWEGPNWWRDAVLGLGAKELIGRYRQVCGQNVVSGERAACRFLGG